MTTNDSAETHASYNVSAPVYYKFQVNCPHRAKHLVATLQAVLNINDNTNVSQPSTFAEQPKSGPN